MSHAYRSTRFERQNRAKKSLPRRLILHETVDRLFHVRLPRSCTTSSSSGPSGGSDGRGGPNRIFASDCDIRDAAVATSRLKNAGSNTLYKQVRVAPMRRVIKRAREKEESREKENRERERRGKERKERGGLSFF